MPAFAYDQWSLVVSSQDAGGDVDPAGGRPQTVAAELRPPMGERQTGT